MSATPLFRALRPAQWVKNLFVLAPVLFGKVADRPDLAGRTAAVAAAFCALASALYLLNDVMDAEADRGHPVKRSRPVASGALRPSAALLAAALLALAALLAVFLASPAALPATLVYAAVTVLYSLGLKRVALLDVFIVASGYVLRVLAGSAAAQVAPSHWLLLCTFFLALFLALSKRRSELVSRGSAGRESLREVPSGLLEAFENITLGTTIVCYALYTVAPETIAWFRTDRLLATVPIVLFGLFRWRLIEARGGGEDATSDLFTDAGLLATVVIWATVCAALIYGPGRG
ncbi:MAG TPA: UbiA prenyltransferase family protein [Thermoanaerobaculia bacterium]|nr:UbiA prenyltransferase family protein [Thermoanaerobaculia bacterium]